MGKIEVDLLNAGEKVRVSDTCEINFGSNAAVFFSVTDGFGVEVSLTSAVEKTVCEVPNMNFQGNLQVRSVSGTVGFQVVKQLVQESVLGSTVLNEKVIA